MTEGIGFPATAENALPRLVCTGTTGTSTQSLCGPSWATRKMNMDVLPIKAWRWNQHMQRSIDEATSELEREAHVRTRCYDRWIEEGKVSRVDAWDRQERLLSAVKHLRDYQDLLKRQAEMVSDTAPEPIHTQTVAPGKVTRVAAEEFARVHQAVDEQAAIEEANRLERGETAKFAS